MRLWHSRRASSLLAVLATLALTGSLSGYADAAAPGPASQMGRSYATKLKQLEVHLLQEGLRERQERMREVRHARRTGRRSGVGAHAPRDRFEPGGPQGSGAVAGPARQRLVQPSGAAALLANVKVNNSSGDAADAGQSEASIAAWNQYVLVGWNDGQGFVTGPDQLGFGYSSDGGVSFTDAGSPPRRATWKWTSDPVVAVNSKTGEFYFCGLVDTNLTTSGVAVVRATFSGSSIVWGTPQLLRATAYSNGFIDKPWIAVDSLSGNLYVTYTFFGVSGDTIDFQRSTNKGSTWSNPAKLSAPGDAGRVQGSRPVVGPNGEIYATWYVVGVDASFQDYFKVRKSTDNGVSFAASATAVGVYSNFGSGAPGFNRGFSITYPSIAVDCTRGNTHSGRVYLGWNEGINFYDDDLGSNNIINDSEPNDAPATATPFVVGDSLIGGVGSSTDFDYWSFTGVAGQTIIAYCDSVAPALDMSFRLFCTDGVTRLAFSAPGTGRNNLIVFTLPTTGTYYLRTAAFSGTGHYSIITGFNTPGPERARDHRDAFVTYSDDGGTWSTPTRMSDSPANLDDWLPEVAVSAHGHPYGIWYDWRNAPGGTCGGVSDIYLARSDDDGPTWTSIGAVTDAQTAWTTTASNIEPNQGDYLSLFINGIGVYPVWSDGRTGNADIFSVALPIALTPTQTALANVIADVDRVTLTWYSGGARDFVAAVERREATGDWSSLGEVSPDGSGLITFVDRAVTAGARYAYRLALASSSGTTWTAEAWVEVPLAATFSLAGARPNPARHDLDISFSLPSAAAATLELFDLNGRLLRSKSVAAAGRQMLRLNEGLTLDPGIYLVRLTQLGRSLTARVSVVR